MLVVAKISVSSPRKDLKCLRHLSQSGGKILQGVRLRGLTDAMNVLPTTLTLNTPAPSLTSSCQELPFFA